MSQHSPPFELTSCESEPIHIPGAIQPHGVLLVLEERTFTVMQVSENVEAQLGLAPRQLLNRPLAELVEPAASDDIRAALLDERWNPLPIRVCGKLFHAIVHRAAGASFVELEPAPAPAARVGNHPLRLALKDVQDARTLPRVCQSVVAEVQRLTGFERVMLYRFDDDGHGSVEAEAKRPELEPYLGLHYPASDIPQQARRLYLKNWLRLIPDARYTPARILPTLRPDSGTPLDLSHSVLRSVSPVHLEYLANLGARASMSISLIVRDRLWGLISCLDHTAPRFLEYELRAACEVLGRLTSLQLAALDDQEASALRAGRQGTQELLVKAMREGEANSDVLGALLSRPSELLGLVAAEGVALVSGVEVASSGRCPAQELTVALSAWLDERAGDATFATASLPALYAPALDGKDVASGILSFTLPGAPRRRCVWFRPERAETVSWGGDPRKAVAVDGDLRLHPRRSFALWKEEVRLRSRPWTASDLEAAEELRRNIVEVDLERQVLRERRAVRARDDLVAVVSHDLKNPLGVIQMQAQVLLGSARTDTEVPSRRLRASAERIQRSVDRMNALIHDLLDLAAIEAGRFMLQRRPEDVGEVIHEALLILRPLADSKRISIQEDLVVAARIELDRERFFQVLSNLIGNAIKFTPEGGRIDICTERQQDQLLFTVRDTGPGIAAEQVPHVFDRYWQAREQLRHGSGLGLYIAKGIVEAHGGRIWLEPPAGSGAVFRFALALANT
jgi:light-regulated signal transduction histidine kinase (bacteriophytochrome)